MNVAVGARAQDHLRPLAEGDPVELELGLARVRVPRLQASGTAGRIGLEPPVQGEHLLGRGPLGAVDHVPHRRVLCGDRLTLALRERLDVQQQRLLDLGVVEQVAQALRRHPRMVGEHDRRRQDRVVAWRREHREGVDALRRGDRLAGRALALERRDEAARPRSRPPRGSRAGWRRAPPTAPGPAPPRSCCARRRARRHRPGASSALAAHPHPPAELASRPRRRTSPPPRRRRARRATPGRARAGARAPGGARPRPAGSGPSPAARPRARPRARTRAAGGRRWSAGSSA